MIKVTKEIEKVSATSNFSLQNLTVAREGILTWLC